jgi:SPP1 family predicted phage head-tail adaptor
MDMEHAGALDERVVIERWQSQRDGAGDDVGRWVVVDTLFAAVTPATPLAASTTAEAARSGRRWRVRIRQRADIDLAVRLRWRGQVLAVRAVETVGRRRAWLDLLCEGQPA